MRLSLFISDAEAAEPSELYTLCRRLTIVALAVIGIIAMLLNLKYH